MSLFYFLTIVFIIWELNTLIFAKSYNQYLEQAIKRIQSQNVTRDDVAFSIFNLTYFIWTVVGIFTNLYLFFTLLMLLGITSSFISNKIKKSDKPERIILHRRIDAVMSISILLIILSHLI